MLATHSWTLLDVFRIGLVSAMAALAGGLLWFYVIKIPRHIPGMVHGAISATLLLLTGIFDQIGHIQHPATWRLPMYAAATAVGLFGLSQGIRKGR